MLANTAPCGRRFFDALQEEPVHFVRQAFAFLAPSRVAVRGKEPNVVGKLVEQEPVLVQAKHRVARAFEMTAAMRTHLGEHLGEHAMTFASRVNHFDLVQWRRTCSMIWAASWRRRRAVSFSWGRGRLWSS